MDGMYSAIKSRRGGLLEDSPHEEMGEGEGGVDMKSLVGALSQDQKAQLLSLLVGGEKKASAAPAKDAKAIQEGAMGPGEEDEIEESLGDGHESEGDIAESMISSSDKMRSERGDNPRNLGERVKFDLAKKFKK